MTKQEFLDYCKRTYGTSPDYPFDEDFETAVCGRGKGDLPLEDSFMSIDNQNVHVTAIKRAEDGDGIIVRFYNATEEVQTVNIEARGEQYLCRMDESVIGSYDNRIEPKKIVTVRIK